MNKDKTKQKKVRFKSLVIEGTKYRTHFTRKFENRKPWIPENPLHILSFIPGMILKVFVSEGQKVREGQDLLILEAMKMKNRIKSPLDGKIKAVNVKEGEKVPRDLLLIELDVATE
ncbi:MAG TPA: acetyl-CoA carboxylase biotin carboxyl carrier protein subunit [Bacteroidetes bacterium]|nr:acetyl-CoA carboxylase biotin carboxyl carrier protein subunit [Bacteroidota bacterium]